MARAPETHRGHKIVFALLKRGPARAAQTSRPKFSQMVAAFSVGIRSPKAMPDKRNPPAPSPLIVRMYMRPPRAGYPEIARPKAEF